VLLLAGCGAQSTLSTKALQQEASSLQSLAAEGSLLASDAARGRSTAVFVRIHGAELAKTAQASATLLAKSAGSDARRLAALGVRITRELDRLAHSGSNRTQQQRLAAELNRAAAQAEKLGARL
jgi:hypothetical protein